MRLYLTGDTAAGSNHHAFAETEPASARLTTGWIVATLAPTRYAAMDSGTERASSAHVTTPVLDTPDNTLGNCFRSAAPLTGTIPAGTWSVSAEVMGESRASSTHDGYLRVMLHQSANATGAGASGLDGTSHPLTAYTNLTNSVRQTGTWSGSLPEITLANEYLFLAVTHVLTGAGGNAACDTHVCTGPLNYLDCPDLETELLPLDMGWGNWLAQGQSATLAVGHVAAGTHLALAPAGQNATLAYGRALVLLAGSGGVQGQSAGLVTARHLGLTSAALPVTGQAAVLSRGFQLDAGTGLWGLVGQALTLTSQRGLGLLPGQYPVSGQSLTLAYGHALLSTPLVLTVSGQLAELLGPPPAGNHYELVLLPGNLVPLGQAAILARGRVLVAGAGAISVTGQAAALQADRYLVLGTGSLTFAGQPAELVHATADQLAGHETLTLWVAVATHHVWGTDLARHLVRESDLVLQRTANSALERRVQRLAALTRALSEKVSQ